MNYAEIIKKFGFEEVISIDNDWKLLEDSVSLGQFIGYLNDTDATELRQKMIIDGIAEDLIIDSISPDTETIEKINGLRLSYKNLIDLEGKILEQDLKFSKYCNQSFEINDENKKIWFIDLELDNHFKGHIITLFDKYLSNRKQNEIFIIYTKENTENSYDKVKELFELIAEENVGIVEQHQFENMKNNLLNVNILRKDEEITAEQIINILQKAAQSDLFNHQSKVFIDTIEDLKKAIWNADDQLLFEYDYLVEGLPMDENLFLIAYYNFQKNYINSRKNIGNITNYINEILGSKYELVYNTSEKIEKRKKIGRLQKEFNIITDFEIIDTLVNNPVVDLNRGDIIKISDNPFLVTTNECDMTVRADNERKAKYIKLVPIILEKHDEIKYISQKLKKINEIKQIDKYRDKIAKLVSAKYKSIKNIDDRKIKELEAGELENGHRVMMDNDLYILKYNYDGKIIYVEEFILDLCIIQENNVIYLNHEIPKYLRAPLMNKITNAVKQSETIFSNSTNKERIKAEYSIEYDENNKKLNYYRLGRLPMNIVKSIEEEIMNQEYRLTKNYSVRI